MRRRRHPSIYDMFENLMKGTPFEAEHEWLARDPFNNMIKRLEEEIPAEYRSLVEEEKTPTGEVKRYGPFVYGFSYTAEPGKEPVFREFGNIRPSPGGVIKPSAGREPLVDLMEDENGYRIFAELPGAEKENIKLDVAENRVTIETTDEKKFLNVVDLDSVVDPDSAKATYKNGILSVELEKKEKPPTGKDIKID